MVILITIVTLFFVVVAFLTNLSSGSWGNPFFNYYVTLGEFFLNHPVAVSLGFFVMIIFFCKVYFDKKNPFIKTFFSATVQSLFITLISSFAAFVALFVIAFLQLTILSLTLSASTSVIGIQTNTKTITEILQNDGDAPEVIPTDRDRVLFAIARATTGVDNFYGSDVVQSIPKTIVIPTKKIDAGVMLLDNTLIVTQLSQSDMQMLSPVVGFLFLREYFITRQIKAFPQIGIVTKSEYTKFRNEETKKKLATIDKEVLKMESIVSSLSASLKINKEKASATHQSVTADSVSATSEYRKCLTTKTEAQCESLKTQATDNLTDKNQELTEVSQLALEEESTISAYSEYIDYFKTQRHIIAEMSDTVAFENGVFVPKDTIKIIFISADSHGIADYFETLTHEYLHYASFVPEQKLESTFFEEGLTEYFARKIVTEMLHTETNIGYPVQVKIIGAMTNMIPESEFEEIYFTKDEEALEKAVDRVYGEGFYLENRVLFETLQYASTPQQTLKIANDIMKKIGGEPLTEKDLYSTKSSK
jgi:hypothetical protein